MLLSNDYSKQYFLNSISLDKEEKSDTGSISIWTMTQFFRIMITIIVSSQAAANSSSNFDASNCDDQNVMTKISSLHSNFSMRS